MNNFPSEKKTQPRRKENTQKEAAAKSDRGANTSNKSLRTEEKQADTAPKKKYRMTADGTLKEKRAYNKFPKQGKKRDK